MNDRCMKKILGICLALLFASAPACFGEEPWRLVKNAEGIKVYSRVIPGTGSTEFKGVGEVRAPLEAVSNVLEDIPSYPEWFGFCKESRLLRHDTADAWVVYIVIKTPGPVKDRDVVAGVTRRRDAGTIDLAIRAQKEDALPVKGKYVRMTEMSGSLCLSSTGKETTNVVYTVRSDPGGYIPSWVSDLIQKDQPFLTIRGLREMAGREAYHEKAGIPREK